MLQSLNIFIKSPMSFQLAENKLGIRAGSLWLEGRGLVPAGKIRSRDVCVRVSLPIAGLVVGSFWDRWESSRAGFGLYLGKWLKKITE